MKPITNEIWKDVLGYEGLYQVSNIGNVRNSKTFRIFLAEKTKGGYKRVTLRKNGIPKHHSVHRLVAEAFIPNPHKYPCINHIDENKENNSADNLEWCTYSYNINYGNRNFSIQEKSQPVCQMDFSGNVLAEYISANFAAHIMKVDASNIYKCCRGEISYAYEYKWRFK